MATAIDRAFALARHLAAEDRPVLETHLHQPDARRQLILMCSEAWLAKQ